MSNERETLLGSSKYDGKIRRITLIKNVADRLNMHDGDEIQYYYNGEDVIIRKGYVQEINFAAFFNSMSEDQITGIMDRFCKTNELSDYGKDIDWLELPEDKVEEEFMRTVDSMGNDERIRLVNKLLIELTKKK